ncbi:MAG: hypothetical protein KAQ74_00960 [Dehalococcoidia bacterium]|nr:hypothetical protein [Dehalococcoidia bacterium]
MRLLARSELKELLERPKTTSVSIFLPTHRTGDAEQDIIRFKNLLRQAQERLEEIGMRAAQVSDLLEPARELVGDSLFWHHQAEGLAVFLSPDFFTYYRLPYDFEERMIVASRFHVAPLLPLFSADGIYYVLALSQNRVRLVQCSRDSARDVTPAGLVGSLSDVLQYDGYGKDSQFRTGSSRGASGGSASFHGHGEGKDVAKDSIVQFLRHVDSGVHEALKGESAPLVLAGVKYLLAMYAETNTYPHLLPEVAEVNPDELGEMNLQNKTWPMVESYFSRERADALRQYGDVSSRARTVTGLDRVLRAVNDGRVAELFVALGFQQWGRIARDGVQILQHKEPRVGDEDLADRVVVQALLTGANVHVVAPEVVPGDYPVAALLRY